MNKVLDYLNTLLKKKDIVVVAVSGGADSMGLLNLILSLKNKLDLKIIVAHVNHKLRVESEEEAKFVKDFAKINNLDYEYMEIKEYSNDNLEREAREKRYAFFEKIVYKYNAGYLMTAHHGDDLIETILMRMVRGSSLKGYAGFKKEVDMLGYKIIRPLIEVDKKTIEEYMLNNNLKYYVDKSNFSEEYTRNRYRLHVLPFLKKENKDVHLKFGKFSKEIQEAYEYILRQVQDISRSLKTDKGYNVNDLKKLDNFMLRKLIEEELRDLYPNDLFLISDKNTEAIIKLIYGNSSNKMISLPKDWYAIKSYNYLKFEHTKRALKYSFILDKEVQVPGGKIKKAESDGRKSNYVLRLNSKDVKLPLIVRNRGNGDKMEVKNLKGSKKIKDILIDEKISKEKRDIIPLVVDQNNNILWLCGVKKSKFDVQVDGIYDIILLYEEEN